MNQSQLKWIVDFSWNIADDRLRDVYVRGKYRDVIRPFHHALLKQGSMTLGNLVISGTDRFAIGICRLD